MARITVPVHAFVALLTVLSVGAFFLRFYLIPDRLFFGPEQGKDFLTIRDMVYNHDVKLIGPKTDLPGVFHGPLYYYVSSLPFFISKGDPLWIIGTLIGIQALTVFLAYLAGKQVTTTKLGGILTATIFSVAFGNVVYARWLSGQQLTIPLAFICIYFIKKYEMNRQAIFLLAASSIVGLLGQVQFINYLFLAVITSIWLFLRGIRRQLLPFVHLLSAAVAAVLFGWGNFFLFDIKNNWLILKSIGNILIGGHGGTAPFFTAAKDVLPLYASWISQFSGLPTIFGYGMVLLFIGFLIVKRRAKQESSELLLLFLSIPLFIILLFRRGALDQVFVLLSAPVALTMGWLLSDCMTLSKRFTGTLLALVVSINGYHVLTAFPQSKDIFFQAPQPNITYQKQQEVLRYVYETMGTTPFELQTYTIPYFWQDGWQYLFWRYAATHPFAKEPVEHGVKDLIVVIQDDTADPLFQKNWYEKTVSTWGILQSEKRIGEYRIEHRQYQ